MSLSEKQGLSSCPEDIQIFLDILNPGEDSMLGHGKSEDNFGLDVMQRECHGQSTINYNVVELEQFLFSSERGTPVTAINPQREAPGPVRAKARVTLFREKNKPVIKRLEEAVKQKDDLIQSVSEEIKRKHHYLSGLLRKPYNEKAHIFSQQSLRKDLGSKLDQLRVDLNQEGSRRMRSQKLKAYIRFLQGLEEEQKRYLTVLKTEEEELNSEISKCWSYGERVQIN